MPTALGLSVVWCSVPCVCALVVCPDVCIASGLDINTSQGDGGGTGTILGASVDTIATGGLFWPHGR